jgi:hypothetical protein
MESASSQESGEEDKIVIWLCQYIFPHFSIFSHLLPLEGGGVEEKSP